MIQSLTKGSIPKSFSTFFYRRIKSRRNLFIRSWNRRWAELLEQMPASFAETTLASFDRILGRKIVVASRS